MGRVTLESALGRRSVRTVLAAGLIPATLLPFGLGASGTPRLAAVEPADQGPQQEERPLTVMSSCVVDGGIYVMGGAFGRGSASSAEELLRTMRTLSVVEVYDPASGRWTRGADLATSRGWFSASVVNGKVYAVGGRSLAPDAGTLGVKITFPAIEVHTPAR